MPTGIGDALRAAREQQGRALDDAARATRIRREFLAALEDERFRDLGGDVYAKGFLSQYARWLGLDPEPLLSAYRREVQSGYDAHALVEHPVGRPLRDSPPGWLVWGAVSVAVLVIALALVGVVGGRTPEPAVQPDLVPSVSPTAPATAPSPPRPSPTATPTPTPSPSPTEVQLVVLLEERSWMRVRVEDRQVFEGILEAGQSREFTAPDQLEVRFGNGGGVRLVLNGRDLGSPAGRGQPVTVRCTPQACAPPPDEG